MRRCLTHGYVCVRARGPRLARDRHTMAVNLHLETCIYTPLPPLPPHSVSRSVPLETLRAMAEEEERGRRTPAFQKEFRDRYAAQDSGDADPSVFFADIIDTMQRDTLEKFGFDRDDELALYELRTAAMQYPAEPVFQRSTFIHYNRCGDCPIANNDKLVDTVLYDPVTFEPVMLSALVRHMDGAVQAADSPVTRPGLRPDREADSPLVVITGSYT
jgi:hypothetical protein